MIEDVAALIGDRVRRTPVVELGLPGGQAVTLKLELLQHTGSFKPRGAFANVLSAPSLPSTLVAASGGNHGLAVAYVARVLDLTAQIFVPQSAPAVKVARLRSLGAEVHQVGATYQEAYAASASAAAADDALGVHAYDGVLTLAGQGTTGREIAEQVTDVDSVLVAVGGGGFLGGIASWFGSQRRMVAVEPEGSATYAAALAAGQPVDISPGGLASDSLGASRIGSSAWQAMRAADVASLVVSDDEIVAARELLWRELRIAAEPGGAVALAAVLSGRYRPAPGEKVVVVVCGANADPADLPLD
ncbi:pyridoxal-phosphate dependent enzyme [Epidermidibacterium keratini]|uniref:Pyridoxal-phosphate dependent enzyme n=1 Tax=Epidermidibacterium keratini TaxID=1891644 RepID=A0A7L4YX18_9ACTN|nr:pyridoxal-phosphate dependent enzyme [Epidermidibacterium keratini]